VKQKGLINIDISFPIIIHYFGEFGVIQLRHQLTKTNKNFIENFNQKKSEFVIIDSIGCRYILNKIEKLGYTNMFWGFSLANAGVSSYFADIYLEPLGELSTQELKELGFEILKSKENYFEEVDLDSEIKNWKKEFEQLTDRENVLRYMFYFADISRYLSPSDNDANWRKRVDSMR